jgi:uncharacterized protein (TIGR03435 family)
MYRREIGWKLSSVAWLCLLGAGGQAQQEAGQATIEVDTVKPHPAAVIHNNFSFKRNRFELEDQPVLKLIAFAYGVNPKQVVGAPKWAEDEHWDMSGTTNLMDDATFAQEQQLIRQLLTERFGLKFHHEQREMSAYALQVVKGRPTLAVAANPGGQPIEHTDGRDGQRTEDYSASSIGYFLTIRQLFMDRPLVDQTGLKGVYDFKLTYSYGDSPSSAADAPPQMFTAIKEQLGLKFEPVKTAVDVMVIDTIGQPSAN